ncbi:hypothetical protein SAMN04488510_11150 [Fervidobacterium changbaicum]|uniref:Uncharacterized protein n=1 Tax=Fervidobacterium changbaicum TaxID=310769 RepID=A0ABX5QQA8_9BACT|nr:DUF5696 domain-containing protein [Fervidobacterium changbaicum]QAV32639.1 hypothetical protein CBS1_01990 [Fervidobacterium changbaicum]SDH35973.1 hypothetical protein SAMN04488510_11150 [Fervidobacterium changbaicum]
MLRLSESVKKNIKKILLRSIVIALIVIVMVWLVNSGSSEVTVQKIESFSESSYAFFYPNYHTYLENQYLTLMFDTKTLQFRVVDKRNNALWKSILEEEDKDLNQTWNAFFNTPFTVEFYDSTGNIKRVYSTRDAKIILKKTSSDTLKASVMFENIGASFDVSYQLLKDSIRLRIENIKEGKYKLTGIFAYPYFGGTYGTVNGSFILADGVGAGIDLSKRTVATAPFKARIYGQDIGFREVLPYSYFKNVKEPENYALPLYGIIYSQSLQNSETSAGNSSGLLAFIEDGDMYAEINAFKAGIVTEHNWITARTVLRDLHKKLLNKAGEGITVPQEELNTTRYSIRYFFVPNANEFSLFQRFVDEYSTERVVTNDYTFKFDILMAEAKKSTFGFSLVKMTDGEELLKMKNILKQSIPNSLFVVVGYTKGGLALSSPKHLPVEKRILGKTQLSSEDYFYVNYILSPKESKSLSKTNIALNRLEQLMEFEGRYVLSPEFVKSFVAKEELAFEKLGIKRFALASVGNLAFSTENMTRAQVIDILLEAFKNLEKPVVYGANWYAVKLAGALSDIPLTNSGYEIEDRIAPVVPYVLRQFLPVFSEPVNLSSDYSRDLLACIEYGVFPSFYLTWDSSEKLIETHSKDLVSTKFEDWLPKILDAKGLFDNATLFLKSRLIARQQIGQDVFLNTYENGTKVAFNYSEKPFNFNNVVIQPMSFAVIQER